MSEPQIVEALTAMSTSPCPGSGTGTILISTVLFPGRNAAFILLDIQPISFASRSCNLNIYRCGLTRYDAGNLRKFKRAKLSGGSRSLRPGKSSGSDDTIHVPQVFPVLIVFPKKNLPLDQTAVAIEPLDRLHVL